MNQPPLTLMVCPVNCAHDLVSRIRPRLGTEESCQVSPHAEFVAIHAFSSI